MIRQFLQGVQVYIEIRDDDGGNDNKLIDLLLIDHNLPVAESLQQNHTGIYNLVTMNLTITVFCVPGFTGPDCNETDHCFGVNCSGNGECSMDGMGTFHCACNPDFTGELCQTNIDDCVDVDCSGNGLCMDGLNNFTCDCVPGFSGPLCNEGTHHIHNNLKLILLFSDSKSVNCVLMYIELPHSMLLCDVTTLL